MALTGVMVDAYYLLQSMTGAPSNNAAHNCSQLVTFLSSLRDLRISHLLSDIPCHHWSVVISGS